MNTISHIDSVVNEYAKNNDVVVQTWLTGTPAVMFEVSEVIGSEFENIELIVILLIIVLLFFVMKSYTIPFRSVLTVLMSICWTLALTTLLFVNVLGGEVLWLVPLILLVICLGLGMDYDILLTTRIKENVKARGMSNDEAIHQAVVHTGSVITICGLIMGGAFGTLMLSGMTMMQQFGFTLCFAILIDALVVRTYIVPAVMHLLGDWNWKGPKFLNRKSQAVAEASIEDEGDKL
jgi:RND superfamily putative drug exporter